MPCVIETNIAHQYLVGGGEGVELANKATSPADILLSLGTGKRDTPSACSSPSPASGLHLLHGISLGFISHSRLLVSTIGRGTGLRLRKGAGSKSIGLVATEF